MHRPDLRQLLLGHIRPEAVDRVMHRSQIALGGLSIAQYADTHDDDEVREAVAAMFRFDRANG